MVNPKWNSELITVTVVQTDNGYGVLVKAHHDCVVGYSTFNTVYKRGEERLMLDNFHSKEAAERAAKRIET